MPYEGEFASKASHYDIIRNPEVEKFLNDCDYLRPPSEEEGRAIGAKFQDAPIINTTALPERVIAIDGSFYETSIDQYLPSTKIGYVKIGCILINMTQFRDLRVASNRMVDPFRVAKLQNNNSPLTFTLPSANIKWKDKSSVRDAFRAALDHYLYHPNTRFNENDSNTSLRTTLFHLASRRHDKKGELRTSSPRTLKLHKCPSCNNGPITVEDIPAQQFCQCGAEIYPSDCLRLWEEISEHQSNGTVLSRFMLVVEHILTIHYIRYLAENSISLLGSLAFFIDGPLALFGPPAWLHSSIMTYINEINDQLIATKRSPIVIIGLQKTGQIVDHINLIKRFLPNGRDSLFAVDDDYRYQYIRAGREQSNNGFGYETYYGQDFIYNTSSGSTFVFSLPYPYSTKSPIEDFIQEKTNLQHYYGLPKALALIHHFETDLYRNAVIPIALAHKHTAISLAPGGRVLDLLTRNTLASKMMS